VVKKSQLPTTANQINNCKICGTIAQELGASQNSNAPPTFLYAKNGKGTNTPIDVNQPGDTAVVLAFQKFAVTLKVTAKPGTTLYFLCAVHPWMQAKLIVGK
jgi:hypothetical protein